MMIREKCILLILVTVGAVSILAGFQGEAQEKGQGQIAQIVQHFLSPEGQKQFWLVSAVNLISGLSLMMHAGQWDNLIKNPEGWCNKGTALWEYRWRRHLLFNAFGSGVMVAIGEIGGVDGDWGLSYLFGRQGAILGAFVPCLTGQSISPIAKSALILGVPPLTGALFSFYGFYSHADLSETQTR
jgi:hypothetical protein